MANIAALVTALALLMLGGCGSESAQTASDPVTVISTTEVASYDTIDEVIAAVEKAGGNTTTVSSTLGGYDTMAAAAQTLGANGTLSTTDISKIIKGEWSKVAGWFWGVKYYKVAYEAGGYKNLSGLVVMPKLWFWQYPVGVLLLTHPTEVLRAYSPSVTEPFLDGTFTKLFGSLFGSLKYVVVIPDYPGLGDNAEVHPYCLKERLGSTSAALVKIVQADKRFYAGDKDISILGFSEGAYAALATADYMRHRTSEYRVNKVIALSGPYDLSGTMKELMLTAQGDYPAPYFLPYVIAGYSDTYRDIDYLKFDQSVVANPIKDNQAFNRRLYQIMDGRFDGTTISKLIYTVTPEVPNGATSYYGPISMTTALFQDRLANDFSTTGINQRLLDNTLPGNDWGFVDPTVKFLFVHYPDDDCVKYANTQAVQAAWKNYIGKNVTIKTLTDTQPLTKSNAGSTHAASILNEYLIGLKFLLDMPLD